MRDSHLLKHFKHKNTSNPSRVNMVGSWLMGTLFHSVDKLYLKILQKRLILRPVIHIEDNNATLDIY